MNNNETEKKYGLTRRQHMVAVEWVATKENVSHNYVKAIVDGLYEGRGRAPQIMALYEGKVADLKAILN